MDIKTMEEHINETLREYYEDQVNYINGMMKPCIIDFSEENHTITFSFEALDWQQNRVGNLHGGIIALAFDIAISAMARYTSQSHFTPTMDLNVRYMRPCAIGDNLIVKVSSPYSGKRISHYEAIAYSQQTGKSIASATSAYMHIE